MNHNIIIIFLISIGFGGKYNYSELLKFLRLNDEVLTFFHDLNRWLKENSPDKNNNTALCRTV